MKLRLSRRGEKRSTPDRLPQQLSRRVRVRRTRMSDFYSPLPSYDLVRAAEILTDKGANCTGNDLLELWGQKVIELCFSLPDYIAYEDINFPGHGRHVLLSVAPNSFNLFWLKVDYPPNLNAIFSVKEYGSDSEFSERSLWIPTDPHYNTHNDNGEGLCEALRDTYGREKLRIPGAELQKVWCFLTCQPYEKKPTPERVTAKQCRFIVELLRSYNLTDDDFKGSIGDLRIKISNRIPSIGDPEIDDNTLTDWLKKGGVR